MTYNIVGPGFTASVRDGDYAFSSNYGIELWQNWTTSGANFAEIEFPAAQSGRMRLIVDVRPYVAGGSLNAMFLSLGQTSMSVTEVQSFVAGVAFTHNGSVVSRGAVNTTLGSYTVGEWCHVVIDLDTDTDTFDLTVSGPGFSTPLSISGVSLAQAVDEINYFDAWDNGPGSPNSHALDNITLLVEPFFAELAPRADAILRGGQSDRNESANESLLIRQSGPSRSLVGFDLSSEYAGVVKAELISTIDSEDPPSLWDSGRPVEVLRVTQAWVEGNGKAFNVPNSEATRGTGEGVTWNCAIDTDIADQSADCSEGWDGASVSMAERTAPTVNITNGMSGEVVFDVTADVLAYFEGEPFYGWVLKKENENQVGNATFYSREGAAAESDMSLVPRLVLYYLEESGQRQVPVTLSANASHELSNAVLAMRPNPFASSVSIDLDLPGAVMSSLDVFDANGRLVRRLGDNTVRVDRQTISWDGLDDHGRAVGAGTYWVRARTDRGDAVGRMLRVR